MKYTSGTGIIIGIPTLGRPTSPEWGMAFKALNCPINFNGQTAFIKGLPVAEARERICEHAIKENAKYIFFLGDDTVPPPHTLRQLIYRMENDPKLGIVGGIYCVKTEPPAPLVFRGDGKGSYWDWKVGEYFEVSGLGMDCTLVRTEILETIPKPWFKTVDEDNYLDGINHAEMWTEDLYFCKQVLDHTDYSIYADASVICDHYDYKTGKNYTIPSGSLLTRKLVKPEITILDIGCGPVYRFFKKITAVGTETNGEKVTLYDFCEETDEGAIPTIRLDIRDEVNPDYRCDVRQIPFTYESQDVVFSSHVLEHFSREESPRLLTEWVRALKTGGQLILVLPNIEWAAEDILKNGPTVDSMNVLYGAQSNPYDYHMCGYTPKTLMELVRDMGCRVLDVRNFHYNILLRAEKL